MRLRIVERTASTNTDVLGDSRVVEGDWLIALEQEGGKGRQGRPWVSAPGNFFGSTLVVLRPGDPPAQTLSLAAGLALIEAVDAAVPAQALMLKWPNDLMLMGRKLAGILLERSGDRVAVGFGVNLASAPQLADRQGHPRRVDRAGSFRASARRKLRAAARTVADERKLGAGARMGRARPPSGDAPDRPRGQR